MASRKTSKPTTLTIAIAGDGITPKDISLRQLAQLLEATAATLEAVAIEGRIAPTKLSLSQVKNGSAAYDLTSEDPRSRRLFTSFITTARKRGKGATQRTRNALSRLHRVASQTGAALRIDPMESTRNTKPVYLAAPLAEDDTEIEEGTVVYGRVVCVRLDSRDQAAVMIRYDNGGVGEFSANSELMTSAAKLLGAHVMARVTFLRGTNQDHEGEIELLEQRSDPGEFTTAITDARKTLAERNIRVDALAWMAEQSEEEEP